MAHDLSKSLEEEFDGMIAAAYPNQTLGDRQHNALKQAFMGGALIANSHSLLGGSFSTMVCKLELEEFTQRLSEFAKAGGVGRL